MWAILLFTWDLATSAFKDHMLLLYIHYYIFLNYFCVGILWKSYPGVEIISANVGTEGHNSQSVTGKSLYNTSSVHTQFFPNILLCGWLNP